MEDQSETGCCPRFNPEPWDKKAFVWTDKLFVKEHNPAIMHIPLGMGKMMKRVMGSIDKHQAITDMKDFVMLSHDPSPWKCEHLIGVNREVPGLRHERLSGQFLTKVYEGPYRDARKWCTDMQRYVAAEGKNLKKLYFYYTTCPKCAKVYGKNYVVGVAQLA
ncbi:MAG TPA: hypothetical protein P5531_02765 [Bacteroidales bacterium]|nr:hypothetical protein [Bacteroidales bacterium]HSA42559.1 hypothetical protein [Bacteroidales bacterium]